MFDRAMLKDGVPIDTKQVTTKDFTGGIQYDSTLNNNFLSRFVDAIAPCGAENKDGINKPVKLSVEGYASSENFISMN